MEAYYAFSDEAGQYDPTPSRRFLKSHPFYIRATVLMTVEEYSEYQKQIHELKNSYDIPVYEEVKWSDIWSKAKGNPRNDFIDSLDAGVLENYFENVISVAERAKSIKIVLTVTKNGSEKNYANRDTMLQFHLQEAFQRVNSELKHKGFATFILDELADDFANQTKRVCHWQLERGDVVQYSSLYSGILFENSNLSVGIQLADYLAGVFNSFLKSVDSKNGNYSTAKNVFQMFVKPRLRKHPLTGEIMGFGIREVTRDADLREWIKKAL